MADSLAVIISSGGETAVKTALDMLEAATAMEMEAHVYFTGDAVPWVRAGAGDELSKKVAERLRRLKEDGTVAVYACTRAMAAHDIPREELADTVDMPSGFAYFLSVAEEAEITVNF